jgi:hypothetical protein
MNRTLAFRIETIQAVLPINRKVQLGSTLSTDIWR